MSRNILLVLTHAAEAKAIARSLTDSRHGLFEVEWVSGCGDAIERLGDQQGDEIAAVVVDLFLADSQGVDTVEKLLHASPHVPILVLSHLRDESVARLAVQRGAQDYLLQERLDGYSLSKALNNMLERCAYAETPLLEMERAQVTLDSIGDAVISTDVAGNVTYLNAVAESMTGWLRQEAAGRRLQEVLRIIDGESREPALNPLAMAIVHNKTVGLSSNCVLIRRDGYESAIEDTAAPIHDRRGHVTGAVIVFHEVSAARTMAIRMSYLAQHDFLTELPNRLLLNDRLSQAIASAHRHGKSLALLFLDVDHFKRINDSLGHASGDQLLKSIARRLVTCVRGSDTVSRQGGDEFVILLSEVARAEDADSTAAKILAAVSAPHLIDAQELHVTVSVGISVYPADGADAETLIKSADLALFHSKAFGRANHQFYQPNMRVRTIDARSAATL
ncbi:MAG TPA: diguanylate cyclase [Steroidobacteraceae bacterium]|jgi:diguanylate cyclase (GGDEF)-like protein/PAS domain S-box-containing protein|nr:diguanylate cyclase [Steroidobacteraceae bacterium]